MQELTQNTLDQVLQAGPRRAFDPQVVTLLNEVGQNIMRHPAARQYPDLATLGFFLRRKNLERIGRGYLDNRKVFLMGRGLAFHIGPANVPLNFAYSLVASLLAGNPSVVRISSRLFPQVDVFVETLNTALAAVGLSQMVSVLRYDHGSPLNQQLSEACDIRVIWGGDRTIQTFSHIPVSAHAAQIHFANRYSAIVIDAAHYLHQCDAQDVAKKFFNDVYPFEQNACTAPKLVFWLGDEATTAAAKDRFWSALQDQITDVQYQPSDGVGVRHFKAAVALAVAAPVHRAVSRSSLTVLEVEPDAMDLEHGASEGFFLQTSIQDLSGLAQVLDQRCQTLAFVGDLKGDILATVAAHGMKAVDRVVPVGTTSQFSFVWEGKDLIRLMTRSFEL